MKAAADERITLKGSTRKTMMDKVLEGTVSVAQILRYVEQDRYLPIAAAAAYVGLSVKTLRKSLDELPHFRVGKKLLFRRSELDWWMMQYREDGDDVDLDKAVELAESLMNS